MEYHVQYWKKLAAHTISCHFKHVLLSLISECVCAPIFYLIHYSLSVMQTHSTREKTLKVESKRGLKRASEVIESPLLLT